LTSPSVVFEHVSKRFYRGARATTLTELLPALVRRLTGGGGVTRTPFWALRDVSFTADAGHVLGIIGPNGAGKSTILKLISGILRADEGRVVVRAPRYGPGRIGALIELSAGFHFELSGRDNVYLQGAILGMRQAEVAQKFDAIVAFAELEDAIDSPVKRYSTGMLARLGFSIAAHLEPDILLVDEVLSVGDLAFQHKAFARLQELVARGIPAIVVSHQLHQVVQLCHTALLLSGGRVRLAGTPAECVAMYVADAAPDEELSEAPVRWLGIEGPSPDHVAPGARLRVRVRGEMQPERADGMDVSVGVRVRALPRGDVVAAAHSARCGIALPERGPFDLEIDLQMNVGPGSYRAQAAAWDLRGGREVARGPSVLISVDPEPTATGVVFTAPRMRLLAP
jgi:ABC-type polysaccharide/polyol phosphate transport system ATPase subunit